MNKTIKVIDLLNKIASGEELPKKIYCFNREFYLKENTYFGDTFTLMYYIQEEDLNEIVEILEDNDKTDEEAKPITKESIEALGYACGEIQKCFTNGWNKSLENKSLKDNDKLKKIKSLNNVGGSSDLERFKDKQQLNNHILKDKINKIIDHINKIEEKLDER